MIEELRLFVQFQFIESELIDLDLDSYVDLLDKAEALLTPEKYKEFYTFGLENDLITSIKPESNEKEKTNNNKEEKIIVEKIEGENGEELPKNGEGSEKRDTGKIDETPDQGKVPEYPKPKILDKRTTYGAKSRGIKRTNTNDKVGNSGTVRNPQDTTTADGHNILSDKFQDKSESKTVEPLEENNKQTPWMVLAIAGIILFIISKIFNND